MCEIICEIKNNLKVALNPFMVGLLKAFLRTTMGLKLSRYYHHAAKYFII